MLSSMNGTATYPPLTLRFDAAGNPLPIRSIRQVRPRSPLADAPPWHLTGPADQPFDFCGHLRRLLEDIVARCPALQHVDVTRVLLGVTQARRGGTHGLQARVTPLRFVRGQLTRR